MLKEPIRLILITRSKSASGIGPSLPITRLATPMPAQFTSTRAGPCAFDAAATAGAAGGESDVEAAARAPGALPGEPARGRSPQSRCAAGDDGRLIPELHDDLPW